MFKGKAVWVIILSIVLAVVHVWISSHPETTTLEESLLQLIILGLSITGSYFAAQNSAHETARAIIKPHVKSAFRRQLTLYSGLSRLAASLDESKPDDGQTSISTSVIDKLSAMVVEQLATADDAIEDWRELDPEGVQEVQKNIRERKPLESNL